MPKLLVINFFPAFWPPSSGGELRLRHLYRALAETHDITMLTSTDFTARYEEVLHAPRFRELRFPKDDLWRRAYATLEKSGITGELSGLAFALSVSEPTCKLRQTARQLAYEVDYIVHEFPYSEPVFADGAPRPEIYNSHNFEASLLACVAHGPGLDSALLKLIRMEGNLVARCERIFATSQIDAEKFRLFYGADPARLHLCCNGFDAAEYDEIADARASAACVNTRPKLLFLGSAHHPNLEAAMFIGDIAAKLPYCDFILAGGFCKAIGERPRPSNVVLGGPFDAAAKRQFLIEADLFLNPVTLGSGTSIKAIEALAAGVAMLTTPEGSRGLGLVAGKHAHEASRESFAAEIERVLSDRSYLARIAAGGKKFVHQRFNWTRIAAAFAAELPLKPAPSGNPMPLVLVLNDFPVNNAKSGGAARIIGIHETLANDTVVVTFGKSYNVDLPSPNLLVITVPKSASHVAYENAVNEGQKMSINDCVASLFVASNRMISALTGAIARRADAVVFEHPYMAPVLESIRRVQPNIFVVYSAHNVETIHKLEILRQHPASAAILSLIAQMETFLVANADLVVCCTSEDAEHFGALHNDTIVVPNGCKTRNLRDLRSQKTAGTNGGSIRVGFIGSPHGPNATALEFIVRELAPQFPHLTFEAVGSVCSAVAAPALTNVLLHGEVGQDEKTRIMSRWSLALNPLQSGGGSSLKMSDYMAHGLPTISTPAGARGFDILGRDAGQVVDASQFGTTLRTVLSDPLNVHRQGRNAYRYASEELDWSVCTRAYRDRLKRIFLARPSRPVQPGRSLLVVTYRYTEPPLGGAEEYLIEVLRQIRPQFRRIDLAAIDAEKIANTHHFATSFTDVGKGSTARLGELFDKATYFVPEPQLADVLERSRRLEFAWARTEQTLFARFAALLCSNDKPRLFAGFFEPEKHGSTFRRWTAPEFSFLIPVGARLCRLVGQASMPKVLRLAVAIIDQGGKCTTLAQTEMNLPAEFSVSFRLPEVDVAWPIALFCSVDEHHVDRDHRPLGLLLESISVLREPVADAGRDRNMVCALDELFANLADDIQSELRVSDSRGWLSTLRDAANGNSDAIEADFATVRGPHCRELQTWLQANAGEYDTILVQGIPFDIVPTTIATVSALPKRPRLVALPHFHGDDRFYYWRRFLRSFDLADKTFLFSEGIVQSLELGDKGVLVPGGGVRPYELGDPSAVRRFGEVHRAGAPFFLVIGRKTASKGYERVMQAHRALRQVRSTICLVLIGADEDGRPVEGDGVYYLGWQPREVVLGALQSCLGLINMSMSESFGIALCEAWLFGKPVVANRACYSFRELVRQNENGVLVQTDHELFEAMLRLADDDAERSRMGQTGFTEVQRLYTWPAVAEAVAGVLLAEA